MREQRNGPYAVAAPLGSAGMGTRYRGRHVETGVVAALRVSRGFGTGLIRGSVRLIPRCRGRKL